MAHLELLLGQMTDIIMFPCTTPPDTDDALRLSTQLLFSNIEHTISYLEQIEGWVIAL